MKPSQDGTWLKIPLPSTPLSEVFIQTASLHGYQTIGELLAIQLTDLYEMEWFTPSMMEELWELVKSFREAARSDQ